MQDKKRQSQDSHKRLNKDKTNIMATRRQSKTKKDRDKKTKDKTRQEKTITGHDNLKTIQAQAQD